MEAIIVRENLDLEVGQQIVAHLMPEEALSLAGKLTRGAFRRIAFEEGVGELLPADGDEMEGN